MMSVKVLGLREFERNMRRLAKTLERSAKREIARLASETEGRAKQLAPKETGDLAEGITNSGPKRTRGGYEAVVDSTSDHATYVELGTSEMAAHPHLRPAADEVGDRELPRSAKRIGNDLERV